MEWLTNAGGASMPVGSSVPLGFQVLHRSFLCLSTAPNGLFNELIWPKGGFASTAFGSTAPVHFLPLPAAPAFLAETRKFPVAVLH
ncbi:MAG: hypothetical protein JJ937_14515 [Parvibaculum sp.]|uniref:hypothetical protein n=1 Tax=Boseongicola sp. H5 TaxID=2763261 RepID=UPI001B225086|nr:hypothetical protein [Boseongicola sp. H5]MBO6635742.1 hypothetical protein [Parvibaculum sp.]